MGNNFTNVNTEIFVSKFAQLTPDEQQRFSAVIEGFLLAMSCFNREDQIQSERGRT